MLNTQISVSMCIQMHTLGVVMYFTFTIMKKLGIGTIVFDRLSYQYLENTLTAGAAVRPS